MKEQFDQIRAQIHEIRNFLGPLDHKLEGLDYQISRSRASFELKTSQLEAQISEQTSEIALHSEQIRQIQIFLKMPMDNRPLPPGRDDQQSGMSPLNPPE